MGWEKGTSTSGEFDKSSVWNLNELREPIMGRELRKFNMLLQSNYGSLLADRNVSRVIL